LVARGRFESTTLADERR